MLAQSQSLRYTAQFASRGALKLFTNSTCNNPNLLDKNTRLRTNDDQIIVRKFQTTSPRDGDLGDLAMGIAGIGCGLAGIGVGYIGGSACLATARNPGAGVMGQAMLMLAMAEACGLFSLTCGILAKMI